MLEERASRYRSQSLLIAVKFNKSGRSVYRRRGEQLAIICPQSAERGLTEAACLFEHRVEHGREVAGRAVDDP